MHAAVVTGVLPLGTAVAAALLLRQRASAAFWGCALVGCALVIGFAALRGQGGLTAADALLLGAVASASIGYVAGARVSATLPAEHVICWVLVLSLPLTLPAMALTWPADVAAVRAASWAGFAYVTLFSMWLGFFAWYRGLVLGGVMRVSQVQLLQPFLALLAAVPLLGETLDATTLLFTAAVAAVVFLGKRLPVRPQPAGATPS
jgi:drug/metabolite transporter (DMT)-like permease